MFRNFNKMLWGVLLFGAACGSSDNDTAQRSPAAQGESSKLVPDGMAVFRQNCVTCHGVDGALGLNGAKDLGQSILTLEERVNIITNGKKLMTPFGSILSQEEILAVAEYTQTFKK